MAIALRMVELRFRQTRRLTQVDLKHVGTAHAGDMSSQRTAPAGVAEAASATSRLVELKRSLERIKKQAQEQAQQTQVQQTQVQPPKPLRLTEADLERMIGPDLSPKPVQKANILTKGETTPFRPLTAEDIEKIFSTSQHRDQGHIDTLNHVDDQILTEKLLEDTYQPVLLQSPAVAESAMRVTKVNRDLSVETLCLPRSCSEEEEKEEEEVESAVPLPSLVDDVTLTELYSKTLSSSTTASSAAEEATLLACDHSLAASAMMSTETEQINTDDNKSNPGMCDSDRDMEHFSAENAFACEESQTCAESAKTACETAVAPDAPDVGDLTAALPAREVWSENQSHQEADEAEEPSISPSVHAVDAVVGSGIGIGIGSGNDNDTHVCPDRANALAMEVCTNATTDAVNDTLSSPAEMSALGSSVSSPSDIQVGSPRDSLANKLDLDAWRQWGSEISWGRRRFGGSDLYVELQAQKASGRTGRAPDTISPKSMSPSYKSSAAQPVSASSMTQTESLSPVTASDETAPAAPVHFATIDFTAINNAATATGGDACGITIDSVAPLPTMVNPQLSIKEAMDIAAQSPQHGAYTFGASAAAPGAAPGAAPVIVQRHANYASEVSIREAMNIAVNSRPSGGVAKVRGGSYVEEGRRRVHSMKGVSHVEEGRGGVYSVERASSAVESPAEILRHASTLDTLPGSSPKAPQLQQLGQAPR
jgi:hypothetical protein